jgi:integrase
VGSSRERVGEDGTRRWAALYRDLRGRQRSAGTFATEKQADKAWQRAEAKTSAGRLSDPSRGRQTFRHYVETTWLPNHQIELTTRERYTYTIGKHLMPEFGGMRMIDILPEHVRAWIVALKDNGMSAVSISSTATVLSAIFTTALNDQVIFFHPCKGVKKPTVATKSRVIATPEQFDAIYESLPDPLTQLLVETDIESGLRWGELTELRPSDLVIASRMLTVNRTVIQISPQFHPEGGRFLVKDYPKDREPRRLNLSNQIVAKLKEHITVGRIGVDELMFAYAPPGLAQPRRHHLVSEEEVLGFTEPNAIGRTYRHGTLAAYSLGKCRCEHCRSAYANYRAQRRRGGNDQPRQPREYTTDGHIPRDWFRTHIWKPALNAANLDISLRVHDLRHAHASWLLAGGADLQTVKERLGHGSIRTTEKYLHTLPDSDDTALTALDSIRNRATQRRAQT